MSLRSVLHNIEKVPIRVGDEILRTISFQMLCHVLWEISLDHKAVELSRIKEAVEILIARESSISKN